MTRPSLRSESLTLELDPACGGRIASLRHGARELLVSPSVHPDNWGATLWTSPQSDWGWPPVAAVDSEPYALVEHGPNAITLRSPVATMGPRRFHITKRAAVVAGGSIDLRYAITNLGDAPFAMACWEVSRVFPGGLSFFPTGLAALTEVPPHGPLEPDTEAGFSWFDHAAFAPGHNRKLHADGEGGLLAHCVDDLLLLKCFTDTPPADQAPGEGEVELFAFEDGSYVELEVQGAYASIEPGAELAFGVRTHVAPCPVPRTDRAGLAALALDLRERIGAP